MTPLLPTYIISSYILRNNFLHIAVGGKITSYMASYGHSYIIS